MQETEKETEEFAAITRFPTPLANHFPDMSDEDRIAYIAERFRDIMLALGLDMNDESLARSPYRVAKMYVKEVFSGLDPAQFPEMCFVEDEFRHGEKGTMVFVKASFHSFCEHHFVPMNGVAYVAYVPNKKLIGLSKIPRIVRYFAKRPQLQERLTAQIGDSLSILLDTEDVAVSIMAEHHCVKVRGVEDPESHTITNVLRGQFDSNECLRREFLEAVNRADC